MGRQYFFEKKHHTIWHGWMSPTWKRDYREHADMYELYRDCAKNGDKGDTYEEVLNRVTELEPDNPTKKRFISLLKRKIKERDAKLTHPS